jgi:hypothetical protein
LRHAPENPEHELRLFLLAMQQIPRLSNRFLLRRVTYAAGVEQQDIAIVFVRDHPVAPRPQHRRDSLAVSLVHLAAVGLDVDSIQKWKGSR